MTDIFRTTLGVENHLRPGVIEPLSDHAAGEQTTDEVVFAEPGDTTLLGARTLEGMNLRVDLPNQQPVAAGPILAAAV